MNMTILRKNKINYAQVSVPGSKSYTHRILICSALSNGKCTIKNALKSEDTFLTKKVLQQMGVTIEEYEDEIVVYGKNGLFEECREDIYIGNSGTSMRLLAGIAALGKGKYVFCGTERMHKRPIKDLSDALNSVGIKTVSLNENGCPPVEINAARIKGGRVVVNCAASSQFLSALLLISPFCTKELQIVVLQEPVSKPYIDITLDVLEKFGIIVENENYRKFTISGNRIYKSGNYFVEPDCSQASYFWAAGAITGTQVKVKGISRKTKQGDAGFLDVLQNMGCRVFYEDDGISVRGEFLQGITVDMKNMPDVVPTLAVVAAFAKGKTFIKNVGHLRVKESDRLNAVVKELSKMGIKAFAADNDLIIEGGSPCGAVIETYNDHRIAMSFAVAGLAVPKIEIKNPQCVEKSFPAFWDVFEVLK